MLPLWSAACLFLLLALWAGWDVALNNDVSWQYWVARQLRSGAVLYRDIVEVNPPLWFWEAVPLSALAERLGVDASHLAIAGVMLRATLALVLTATLFADRADAERIRLLAGLAILLCVLPLHDFGEREHLLLIGSIPYVALVARRRDGRSVDPLLAVSIGLLAGWAFCLKPHFVLVPLALEGWLAAGQRRTWRPWRPEIACLAAVAAAYGGSVLLFAPDYLQSTVPLARLAYGAFSPPLADLVVGRPWMPAWLLSAMAITVAWRRMPTDAQAATIAAVACVTLYFIQAKGFPYHALSASALLAWALWLTIGPAPDMLRSVARYPLAALALAATAVGAWALGPFTPMRAGRVTEALEALPAGSTVAIISAHSWLAFPLVEDRRFVWPMRNIGLWTLPEIARHGASPAGQAVRRVTLHMIAADLWCHPPDAILMDDPARSPALAGTGFSYETFVRSDRRLETLLAGYHVALRAVGTTLYRRVTALRAHGHACRAIAIRPDLP